jgi:hypothetical protein
VIQLASIVLSHPPSESDHDSPVNKNLQLLMDRLIPAGEDAISSHIPRRRYAHQIHDLDQRVLEIGPLEGHHSIILEKMGVRENIALESRADNLRKCNRIKDKYRLDRTRFLQHDLERLYRGEEQEQFSGQFDLVFCLGVLYHVPEPGPALEWFRSQSPTLFLGAHYPENGEGEAEIYSHRGQQYRCRLFTEGGISDPIMGMSPKSVWPFEPDLLALIRDCGYRTIHVLGRDLQNGTAHITLLAQA